MPRPATEVLLAALVFSLWNAGQSALFADEKPPGLPRALSFTDLQGEIHQLGPDAERDALVLVLLSTDCPVSNSYLPTLNELHAAWSQQGAHIELLGFISDATRTRADAEHHSAEFDVDFPILFDGSGELARLLRPTHTPEAFVLDAAGRLVYHGRIDDTYAELGKRRLEPTTHDVRAAVEALVEGKPIASPYQQPVGCLVELARQARAPADLTFNRDIAPIIHANCTGCHRAGEVAPFSLVTYEDVSKRAGQIVRVIDKGLMPPWRPAEEVGHFLGERRLSGEQKRLIANWAAAGAPEGAAENRPRPPRFPAGWQLGQPDLVLRMRQPFEIPADGPDVFQNFVLPLDFDEDHYVIAAEFKPGNKRVVHHAIFYLDSNGVARQLDERDPQPGYASFGGPGFLPTGALGGWSPGTTPRILPGEYCRYAAAGSELVLQIHYHPTGKPETDQSEIGLYFIERPKNVVANVTLANFDFRIAAGERDQVVRSEYSLPDDVKLVGLTPHMHLLGRTMRVSATYPDGTSEDLIRIDDWHFYWQDQYYLQTPKRLPRGTQLRLEAHYDNSADNPFNPTSPPKTVTFGEETTDEMCFCFCLVATDSPYDLRPVVLDNLQHVVRQRVRHSLAPWQSLLP